MAPNNFKEIWFVDFEFIAHPGEKPKPICLVALELRTGKKMRVWKDELEKMKTPPYSIDSNSLFVAYYASAEIGCHISLSWPIPENILDLFTEFRKLTNGLQLPSGSGLLGAGVYFGQSLLSVADKKFMRDLILNGENWSQEEIVSILNYCESDVIALKIIYEVMISSIDLPLALLRGRYMKAAATIEYLGIPIDQETLTRLNKNWKYIQKNLIKSINDHYDVYDGLTFKYNKFQYWVEKNEIPWPQLESDKLELTDKVFKEMALKYPEVRQLYDLRSILSKMKLNKLTVGSDERNRTLLSAFRSRTGRNQPSNSKFIFGQPAWLRGLIKPKKGYGLAYIDWSQQEFGVAGALSGDQNLIDAYTTGDPYLAFAKQCGAVPKDGSKSSHPNERDLFKACVLAVQYGMGAQSLAIKISQPISKARQLLKLHHQTYKKFWEWSDRTVDYAMLNGKLWTVFGWIIHVSSDTNPRFIRNFLMQANGSEMLRLACCIASERSIKICAPVHDAILIEAPIKDLSAHIKIAQEAMAEASKIVLDGFSLRTDVKTICYPERFMERRGETMWNKIIGLLNNEGNNLFIDEYLPVH